MSQEIPSFASAQMGAPEEVTLVKGTQEWAQHEPVDTVDPKDADTPDNWVHRHPAIQRLTGRHPLNCEPTVEMLMASGFITPVSLHYVRNHGAAPKLDWSSHRVEVNGLVDKPTTFSMDDILKLPSVTIPVTLVCAGNRRKEENMLKKSIGFNWGPCAVSTGYWTGVRLSDVLKHVGVKGVDQGAQYVSFRGPRAELPKGDDGSYGTSLLLSYVMDPSTDIILAYKHNGRWLTPDHGYPIRIVIPGFIGGRMVKWLSEITVTPQESDNFYHYHDNRVMPPHVDEALAKEEGWWFKPDFIINELNINSAITTPAHDEVVPLASNLPYMAKGYAYTGGGRKIIRVEVSTDDAATWRQAEIKRFEKPNAFGKHWCWVMWEFPLQTIELLNCKELLVRAWDSSMNGQPAVITWNLMGMMNNCYFRIRIHPHTDAAGNIGLRFQHPAPVTPGPLGNIGWREEENLARQGEAPPAPAAAVVAAPVAKAGEGVQKTWFTMEEVAVHNTEESAWFVHEGKVYDATPFLDEHPGGAESILISTGMDATDEFNSIHSSKAKGMLAQYLLGDLVDANEAAARRSAAAAPSASAPSAAAPSAAPVASTSASSASTDLVSLNPREKIAFRLAEKIELSHNVRLFRFALQSPQHRFGLPVGKHVFLYATIGGETVMRAYTPTSSDDELGYFDLVVKIYRAGEHPRFPDGGKMSQHLDTLAVGDTIDAKGPVGHFVYTARGAFTNNRKHGTARRFSMIAGGTGITPCYQVIKAVLKDTEDKTELALLYANQTEDDILLREELDALAAAHPNFKVWYTLDRPPAEGWAYSSGFINEDMLRDNLFPAGDDTLCLMCGPPPMLKFACVPNLLKLGYKEEHLVNF